MSKEKEANGNGNGNGHASSSAPEGWKRIETNRPVYQGDRGKGAPIQGLMLGILDMPPANGKEWQALVVRLTVACPTCKDREDKTTTAPAGSEILVPLNHQLRQHLARAASHPTAVAEVFIKPTGQVKTTAGSMTTFDIAVNPQLRKREPTDRLLAMQSQAPQLSGPGASGHGTEAESDFELPFS